MKKLFYFLSFLFILSCNSGQDSADTGDDVYNNDSSVADNHGYVDPNVKPFTGRGGDDEAEAESKARRAIIYMAIDSSYFAINAIEDVKNELGAASSVNLTVPERNLKSKAILRMNIIQNSLARQVDSALLANLKVHTAELENINHSISDHITHLKDLSKQLDKVSMIMSRLTDVLTMCISKGLVKPPTPIASNPEEVKETVN